MTQEQLMTLVLIYNSLMTIETKGNNTRTMTKCLDSLLSLIIQESREKGEAINGNEIIPTLS